jgi:hypothetical protein
VDRRQFERKAHRPIAIVVESDRNTPSRWTGGNGGRAAGKHRRRGGEESQVKIEEQTLADQYLSTTLGTSIFLVFRKLFNQQYRYSAARWIQAIYAYEDYHFVYGEVAYTPGFTSGKKLKIVH